jgi:DNA invertase Pin-like site-specific DNA recombinase
MLTVLGGLAEFERELIRARTSEGRARAKANGKSLGRPHKLTPHQQREALRRREDGEPVREIAYSFNVHHATISASGQKHEHQTLMHRNVFFGGAGYVFCSGFCIFNGLRG